MVFVDQPAEHVDPLHRGLDSCSIRERLDYILLSSSLRTAFVEGYVFRKGLWGSRATRPDKWVTYSEMETSVHQASDHGVVVVRLDL